MPAVDVKISPEVLAWALRQMKPEKLDNQMTEKISCWIEGTKIPTFNQIKILSQKANIPLGYFFLQTPPKEELELLNYRTINSIEFANPSRELIDVVHDMENIQDWMRTYREDLGYERIPFVESLQTDMPVEYIAERIRKDLGLGCDWYEECRDGREAFNYVRGCLEECGVLVMMSGIVGNNTHRALKIEEFRAFAMVDSRAPLIFVNAVDSLGGRLFSLMHEVAHIWLGKNDLYNDRGYRAHSVPAVEVVCNAVASELLAPRQVFLGEWNPADDMEQMISTLSRKFHCSQSVIARKALDNRLISNMSYEKIIQNALEQFELNRKNKQSSGGDYYNNLSSRLDGCFVRALCESIHMGRTSYAEAYRMTFTNRKTFSGIAQKLGGVV